MLRWLALGLLLFVLGCEEKGDWGPNCNSYRLRVNEECELNGAKGGKWSELCPKYREAIQQMESSVPPEGTTQKKFDGAEEQCAKNLNEFEGVIQKNPQLFPK